MVEVIWSDNALSDIEEIAAYIERDSKHYASLLVSEIFERGNLLSYFPRIGRKVPERNAPQIREIQVPPYRVIYKLAKEEILILTVLHSRRNVKKLLRRLH
ncbi:MAG: type II toxin-antitoxin system RelE/ParE family toxin [Bacteroidota bacterium]|nr:type II toxin-antitoxin system RelE/ParE family toxin [Bacteroidota bacterium]MDP4228971.1 type II toxin-antitoxin system RelE/ParE family toxin [Bacteroidota bacterium]MDP4237106.1 type II toxin-antitoxin system RelE/ParE family toxin [Bacteroidota bacterium]